MLLEGSPRRLNTVLADQIFPTGQWFTTASKDRQSRNTCFANLPTYPRNRSNCTGRANGNCGRPSYPQIKVLFSSGYTDNAIVHHGRLDADVQLLAKPYTRETLATRVRSILDS